MKSYQGLSRSITLEPLRQGVKAILTAGFTADRRRKLPLLIEFKAQIL